MSIVRFGFFKVIGLLVVSAILLACSDKGSTLAAPLGDRQVLQHLADTYSRVQQELPVNPSGLLPMGKRKFVERVFTEAGYNYTSTLLALAAVNTKDLTPYYNDMRELLFLPHTGNRPTDMREIYSDEELAAIKHIDEQFNSR